MKIYTKNGDGGDTSIRGNQISKNEPLLEVVGGLDELNSALGSLHTIRNKNVKKLVLDLQDDIFVIGANLAGRKEEFDFQAKTRLLEKNIDELSDNLPTLKHFILPGGSKYAAWLHMARAITRRVERRTVSIKNKEKYKEINIRELIKYLNRLSDLLFVMARHVNFKLGVKEVLWPRSK